MKLEVGQKLWYVPEDGRQDQREVKINSVGRKWAKTDYFLKVDINTLQVDGGQYSYPGKCYLSQEEYDNYMSMKRRWMDISRKIPLYDLPKGMTQEKIDMISMLIFGGDDEKISQ